MLDYILVIDIKHFLLCMYKVRAKSVCNSFFYACAFAIASAFVVAIAGLNIYLYKFIYKNLKRFEKFNTIKNVKKQF